MVDTCLGSRLQQLPQNSCCCSFRRAVAASATAKHDRQSVQLAKGAVLSTVTYCTLTVVVDCYDTDIARVAMVIAVLLAAPIGGNLRNSMYRRLARFMLPGAVFAKVEERGLRSGMSESGGGKLQVLRLLVHVRWTVWDVGLCMPASLRTSGCALQPGEGPEGPFQSPLSRCRGSSARHLELCRSGRCQGARVRHRCGAC